MSEIKPGIYPGISRADYNSIDALNISLLIEGERSMAHLKYALDHGKTATDAMEKGTALHLALFEPSAFEKTVTYYPHESSKGKVRNGSEWENFKANRDEDLILKHSDYDAVITMRDAIKNHPRASDLLNAKGTGEMGAVWIDETTGILCKGLFDRFCQCWGYSIVLDLKSCPDARPDEFSKKVYNLSYHTKAAWYLDGLSRLSDVPRRFLWIAVESAPFHGVNIFDPSQEMLATGQRNYYSLIQRYAKCKETGVWPGYDLGEETLDLPKFAK